MSPREARLKRGLSLPQFCNATGLDQGMMSRIERGKSFPSSDTAAVMITYYEGDLTWEELFNPASRAEWIARLEIQTETAAEPSAAE